MKFGLLSEIEVARPWTEMSVADCFWETIEQVIEQVKVASPSTRAL